MKKITQSQINDYQNCAWRYYLAYIKNLVWPAPLSAKYRQIMRAEDAGNRFHSFVHRSVQGVSVAELVKMESDAQILKWIDNFQLYAPLNNAEQLRSELEVYDDLGEQQLCGTFDIIAVRNDQLIIYDWKTTEKPARHIYYEKSAQTRLYCYLLRKNYQLFLPDLPPSEAVADHIQMIYWFPASPQTPVLINYSEQQFSLDTQWLLKMSEKMTLETPAAYPQTQNIETCGNCRFLTYCQRNTDWIRLAAEE